MTYGKRRRMIAGWQKTRKTFRHGNLAEALVEAAVTRLEAAGADSLSLRELARDAGVNHRAVYRHFPDKLSLLARVAEEGWKRLASRMQARISEMRRGEASAVASGVAFFLFAREHPSLFRLMGGPGLSTAGRFPALSKAVDQTLLILMQGFLDAG